MKLKVKYAMFLVRLVGVLIVFDNKLNALMGKYERFIKNHPRHEKFVMWIGEKIDRFDAWLSSIAAKVR